MELKYLSIISLETTASEKTEKLGRVTGSSVVEICDVTVASDIFSFFYFLEHPHNNQY